MRRCRGWRKARFPQARRAPPLAARAMNDSSAGERSPAESTSPRRPRRQRKIRKARRDLRDVEAHGKSPLSSRANPGMPTEAALSLDGHGPDDETDPGEIRAAVDPAEPRRRRGARLHRARTTPWKTRRDCPKNLREARETGKAAVDRDRRRVAAGPRAMFHRATRSSCSPGSTARGATLWCRLRDIDRRLPASSRSARRSGPIRSDCMSCGFSPSTRDRTARRRCTRLPRPDAGPRHQTLATRHRHPARVRSRRPLTFR